MTRSKSLFERKGDGCSLSIDHACGPLCPLSELWRRSRLSSREARNRMTERCSCRWDAYLHSRCRVCSSVFLAAPEEAEEIVFRAMKVVWGSFRENVGNSAVRHSSAEQAFSYLIIFEFVEPPWVGADLWSCIHCCPEPSSYSVDRRIVLAAHRISIAVYRAVAFDAVVSSLSNGWFSGCQISIRRLPLLCYMHFEQHAPNAVLRCSSS